MSFIPVLHTGATVVPYQKRVGELFEFHHDAGGHLVVSHDLPVPIHARYMMFKPRDAYNYNVLRIELVCMIHSVRAP